MFSSLQQPSNVAGSRSLKRGSGIAVGSGVGEGRGAVAVGNAAAGLEQAAAAEEFLADLGFANYRARHHGELVRIEVPAAEFARLADEELRRRVVEFMRGLGFKFVTVDLSGYRVGGAN